MTATLTVTAAEMKRALYQHFSSRWAVLTEVAARPEREPIPLGATRSEALAVLDRRRVRLIDMLLVRPIRRARGQEAPPADGGIERFAIEIKVSRSDFFSDIKNPNKQAPWRELAHRHAYAVPDGLIRVDEVPTESGLIVVSHTGRPGSSVRFARNAVKPRGHRPGTLPIANQMDAWWRASRAEATAKGLAQLQLSDDSPDDLRATIDRLTRELKRTQRERDHAAERMDLWRKRAAAVCPLPCSTCGKPLHYTRRFVDQWEHRDADESAACLTLRTADAQAQHDALPEHERSWRSVWTPNPKPADVLPANHATTAA